MIAERHGEFGDGRPVVVGGVGRWVEEVAPGGDALDYCEEVTDLGGFECGSLNAGFLKQERGIEEAVKLEASAAAEHGADLRGALMLLVDPGEVGGGIECENPCAAEGGLSAAGDVVAEARPFQGCGAGFAQRRRDDRQ